MEAGLEIRPEVVAEIEDAFVHHWSVFGRWPKGALHDEQGVLRRRDQHVMARLA
jgi:hypothetical protein